MACVWVVSPMKTLVLAGSGEGGQIGSRVRGKSADDRHWRVVSLEMKRWTDGEAYGAAVR